MKYLASQPTTHLILSILLPKHIERFNIEFSRFFIASAAEALYIVTIISICVTYSQESFTCNLFSCVSKTPTF